MEAVDPATPQSNEPRTEPLSGQPATTTTEATNAVTTDGATTSAVERHTPLPTPAGEAQSADKPHEPHPDHRFSIWHLLQSLLRICLLTILLAALAALVFEMRTSWLQSYLLPPYAKSLTWQVATGPSDAIDYPGEGPFDKRLGYTRVSKRGNH